MAEVGRALRLADVRHILLVHGTFVGPDAWGLLSQLSRFSTEAAQVIAKFDKAVIDRVVGEAGNYTQQYEQTFSAAINQPDREPIRVERFHWSSENNHIGRAHGAVTMLRRLAELHEESPGRVLLWGHSHAGNVFALATNLLGGDRAARRKFFRAARIYYRNPCFRHIDLPVWREVEQRLDDQDSELFRWPPDIVTFGTPIRYGWETAGYGQLMHFIHHKPKEGQPQHTLAFPPAARDVFEAADGDYVQHFGIAGTNIAPPVISPRSLLADIRLNRLLQPGLRARDLFHRLSTGMRVPAEGATRLVDYGPQGSILEHMAGHAVYTRLEWLLFHAEELVKQFYSSHRARPPE
ncbi:MAG: hypothetical protein KDA42_11485 [Planctomycetales bacterium]|nr:hypothetical protein [Planctomycetales bacterium]